ncbi:hypothetical protein ACYOEI_24645, partial [Singulisphaera rosea]
MRNLRCFAIVPGGLFLLSTMALAACGGPDGVGVAKLPVGKGVTSNSGNSRNGPPRSGRTGLPAGHDDQRPEDLRQRRVGLSPYRR